MTRTLTLAASATILALACGASFAMPPKPGSQIPRVPGIDTTPQMVKLPDLIPFFSTKGGAPAFAVTNAGKLASAPSTLYISCQQQSPAVGPCPLHGAIGAMIESSDGTLNVPALNPGDTKWFGLGDFPGALPAAQWASGAYTFNETADSKQQVQESNENNNTSQGTWNK